LTTNIQSSSPNHSTVSGFVAQHQATDLV